MRQNGQTISHFSVSVGYDSWCLFGFAFRRWDPAGPESERVPRLAASFTQPGSKKLIGFAVIDKLIMWRRP
jgi:hypothetical protein